MRITEQWVRPPAEHPVKGAFYIAAVACSRGYYGFVPLYCLVEVLLIEQHYCLSKCSDARMVQRVHLHREQGVVSAFSMSSIYCAVTVIGKSETSAICALHNNHSKRLLINWVSPGSVIY